MGWKPPTCDRIGGCLKELGHKRGLEYTCKCDLDAFIVPNYLNSRDAMAEALAGLTPKEKGLCWDWIHRIVHDNVFWPDDTTENNCFDCLLATPPQLAESYLKTKGLWEE